MKKKRILSITLIIILVLSMIKTNYEAKAETFSVKEWYKHVETNLEKTDKNWEFQVGPYRKDGKK
ncbi:hypothetical protein, partial [uncultured Clostridium sp.]|uniref:hypothetical protein n=1 Tax=uncultured Clostridium sp. TaxID=59620 RepID=UPI0025D2C9B0